MSDNNPLVLEHKARQEPKPQRTSDITHAWHAAVEATKDDIEEKNDDKSGGEPFVDRYNSTE